MQLIQITPEEAKDFTYEVYTDYNIERQYFSLFGGDGRAIIKIDEDHIYLLLIDAPSIGIPQCVLNYAPTYEWIFIHTYKGKKIKDWLVHKGEF